MSQLKKKSAVRCLYSCAYLRGRPRLYRHRMVATEPARYTIQLDARCSDAETSLAGKHAYADRSQLEAKGYTRASFDGGIEGSVMLFLTKSAAADALLACPESVKLRSEIFGEQPVGPDTPGCDLSDEQDYVVNYAEIVREIVNGPFPAPRGVWDLDNGSVLIFGNDASPDDRRFEHEVATVRRRMTEAEVAEDFGYAVSKDGRSWALLVYRGCFTTVEPALMVKMNTFLWEAWSEACQIAQP